MRAVAMAKTPTSTRAEERVALVAGCEEPVLIVNDGSSQKVRTLAGIEFTVAQMTRVEDIRAVTQSEFLADVPTCPLCGHSMGTPIGQVQQLFWKVSLLRCPCGLVRKEKFARSNVLAAIYGESYSNFTHVDQRTAIAAHGPRIARLPIPKGRLLDVGCGSGSFVAAAQAAGYEAHGIDPFLPDNAANTFGLRKLSIFEASNDSSLGKFDIVTLWAVWEHLERPLEVLTSAKSLLSPGGILVLNSPAGDSLHARYRTDDWYMATLVEHLHFLTRRSLQTLAQQLQLMPISVRSAGVPFPLGGRGRGRTGQGLTIEALNKILGLESRTSVLRSKRESSVLQTFIMQHSKGGLGGQLAKSSLAGKVLRAALDKARIGDHLELFLRMNHA